MTFHVKRVTAQPLCAAGNGEVTVCRPAWSKLGLLGSMSAKKNARCSGSPSRYQNTLGSVFHWLIKLPQHDRNQWNSLTQSSHRPPISSHGQQGVLYPRSQETARAQVWVEILQQTFELRFLPGLAGFGGGFDIGEYQKYTRINRAGLVFHTETKLGRLEGTFLSMRKFSPTALLATRKDAMRMREAQHVPFYSILNYFLIIPSILYCFIGIDR